MVQINRCRYEKMKSMHKIIGSDHEFYIIGTRWIAKIILTILLLGHVDRICFIITKSEKTVVNVRFRVILKLS